MRQIEPLRSLLSPQHNHLPLLVGRDVRVRVDSEDGVGLRPILRGGSPDSGEIEPIPVSENDTVTTIAAAEPEFRCRDETAMARESPFFGAYERERLAAGFARSQAPTQFYHLHTINTTPNDDAALVERCVDIKHLLLS